MARTQLRFSPLEGDCKGVGTAKMTWEELQTARNH